MTLNTAAIAYGPPEKPVFYCPFCEEEIHQYAGRHLEVHRANGDTPLPLDGSLVQEPDGHWSVNLVTVAHAKPIFVGVDGQHLATRSEAEAALKKRIERIAHGKPQPKTRRREKLAVVQTEIKAKPPKHQPSTDFDTNIIAALDKLIGGVPVRAKDIPRITAWVEQTRRLVQELS